MRSGNMPKSLYQNWQFAIEVNGFDVALFKKGQEPTTASIRWWMGTGRTFWPINTSDGPISGGSSATTTTPSSPWSWGPAPCSGFPPWSMSTCAF